MPFVVDEPVVVNSGVHVEQRGTEQPIENQLSTVNPQQPNSCHPTHVLLPPIRLHPPPLTLDWSAEAQVNPGCEGKGSCCLGFLGM